MRNYMTRLYIGDMDKVIDIVGEYELIALCPAIKAMTHGIRKRGIKMVEGVSHPYKICTLNGPFTKKQAKKWFNNHHLTK